MRSVVLVGAGLLPSVAVGLSSLSAAPSAAACSNALHYLSCVVPGPGACLDSLVEETNDWCRAYLSIEPVTTYLSTSTPVVDETATETATTAVTSTEVTTTTTETTTTQTTTIDEQTTLTLSSTQIDAAAVTVTVTAGAVTVAKRTTSAASSCPTLNARRLTRRPASRLSSACSCLNPGPSTVTLPVTTAAVSTATSTATVVATETLVETSTAVETSVTSTLTSETSTASFTTNVVTTTTATSTATTTIIPAPPAVTQAITNGGFEQDGGWVIRTAAPGVLTYSFANTNNPFTGSRSALVAYAAGASAYQAWFNQVITLKANTHYSFSGWTRASAANPGCTVVYYIGTADGTQNLKTMAQIASANLRPAWVQSTGFYDASAGGTYTLNVRFLCSGTPGRSYFIDDLSLVAAS